MLIRGSRGSQPVAVWFTAAMVWFKTFMVRFGALIIWFKAFIVWFRGVIVQLHHRVFGCVFSHHVCVNIFVELHAGDRKNLQVDRALRSTGDCLYHSRLYWLGLLNFVCKLGRSDVWRVDGIEVRRVAGVATEWRKISPRVSVPPSWRYFVISRSGFWGS